MKDAVFAQAEYNAIVGALDDAMTIMRRMGKSEEAARVWLKDFVSEHYCNVWREIASDT
jgi:hypothetical protein